MNTATVTPIDAARAVITAAPTGYLDAVTAAAAAHNAAPKSKRAALRAAYEDAARAAYNAAPSSLRADYVDAYNAAETPPRNIFIDLLDADAFREESK